MPLLEFLTLLIIFYTFAFTKKCMRSLHAQPRPQGAFPPKPGKSALGTRLPACLDTFLGADSLQSPCARVLMVGLYDLSKKGMVVACVTIYKQTNFRRAEIYGNKASFSQPMMHHL